MRFLKFHDKDEGKVALVFYYEETELTWMIESDDSVKEQADTLGVFESMVCQLMFAIHENKAPQPDADADKLVKYCIPVSKDSVYASKGLRELTGGSLAKPTTKKQEEEKQSYDEIAQHAKAKDGQI